MKLTFLLLCGILSGCAGMPSAENNSGLDAKIESVKNHSEGLDLSVALNNTTKQTMRLFEKGSVVLLLDGEAHFKGHLAGAVDIAPGKRKTVRMQFHFINEPRIYKVGLIEIIPTKIFRSCAVADKDPDVVHSDGDGEGREVASEVEADTCNRVLKRPIRLMVP